MSTREPKLGALAPRVLERLEGLAVAVMAVLLYNHRDGSWLLFSLLILLPDISIPLYFLDKRLGAAAYNLTHTYIWSAVLAAYGAGMDNETAILGALIWITHIGIDRSLGLGLKYPTDFKDTHLQRI